MEEMQVMESLETPKPEGPKPIILTKIDSEVGNINLKAEKLDSKPNIAQKAADELGYLSYQRLKDGLILEEEIKKLGIDLVPLEYIGTIKDEAKLKQNRAPKIIEAWVMIAPYVRRYSAFGILFLWGVSRYGGLMEMLSFTTLVVSWITIHVLRGYKVSEWQRVKIQEYDEVVYNDIIPESIITEKALKLNSTLKEKIQVGYTFWVEYFEPERYVSDRFLIVEAGSGEFCIGTWKRKKPEPETQIIDGKYTVN